MILLGKKMFDFIPFITEANLSPNNDATHSGKASR